MAILVKPNGLLGQAYMAAITPFRYLIVYPRMLKGIGRKWLSYSGDRRSRRGIRLRRRLRVSGSSMTDTRSAEELVRAGLQGAPSWLRVIVLIAHRHVLRLELAPPATPNHLLGWEIVDRRARQHQNARHRPTPRRGARGQTRSCRLPQRSRRSSATGDRCWLARSGQPWRPSIARSRRFFCEGPLGGLRWLLAV